MTPALNRPRVALTGGTGLLGQHLRRALSDHPVVLLSRQALHPGANESVVRVDLDEPLELNLSAGTTLVHLAWTFQDHERNRAHARHLIQAVNATNSIERVIVLSSISVYGQRRQGYIDEQTPPRPDSEYSRVKLACEHAWLDGLRTDVALTVLRPSTVLVPGGPALVVLARDALHRPVRALAKRWVGQRTSVHFVAVADVVAALQHLIDRPHPRRQLLLIADDQSPENESYATLQDTVRAANGRPRLPTPWFPPWGEPLLRWVLRRPVGVQRRFSTTALAATGYELRSHLRPGIEEFLAPCPPAPSSDSTPAHR